MYISNKAIIINPCFFGKNVYIGPYSVIGPNVEIGDNTWIDSNVIISGPTFIGSNNKIFSFSKIGVNFYNGIEKNIKSFLFIGNNNVFGYKTAIHKGFIYTSIGNNNYFMFNTYIANDCVLENNIILSRHVSVLSNAYIDNFVTLSDFVRVKQNISIGSYSFLGTGSIISKDILPYFSFFGEYPDFRSLNLIMFKKFFFKHSSILRLKKIYNLFFYYNLSSKQIISLLLSKKYFSFESKLIVTFLLKSKKGLVK